jgi:hypothetical protein
VDLASGAEKQRIRFVSDNHNNFEEHFAIEDTGIQENSTPFDFVNKAYYVEATIGHPAAISIIQISGPTTLHQRGRHARSGRPDRRERLWPLQQPLAASKKMRLDISTTRLSERACSPGQPQAAPLQAPARTSYLDLIVLGVGDLVTFVLTVG